MSTTNSRPRRGDDKHARFTQWAKERGVEIHGLRPASIPGRGLGLITTKQLQEGDRILFIPEKAMFKPDANFLKNESLDQASPQAQLALSAMIAFGNAESGLKVWIDTWPILDDFKQGMPMCWSKDMQQMLPPSVHQPLERQLADYDRDWSASKALCEKYSCGKEDFLYYWMIVNSRSFHWKPPHEKAGSMVMCPFIDYINHGPTGSTCRVRQSAKGYEVIADRHYKTGEEVLATYGSHSNDKLLVHYGFVCSNVPSGPSPDDDIRLDHLIIPRLSTEVHERLQDVGFLGAYALLPATNEICFKTQVAVRAALLTCNEWEYFVACGEDLSVDYTSAVNDFVRSLLVDYRRVAIEHYGAPGMLGLRWSQIVSAIDAFAHSDGKK